MRRIVICAAVVAAGVTIIAAGGHRDARVAAVKASNAVLRTPTTVAPTTNEAATVAPTTTTEAPTIGLQRAAPVEAGSHPKPTATKPRTPVTIDPAQLAFLRARALSACLATAGANHAAVMGANDAWHTQQLRRLAAIRPRPNAQYVELQIQEQQAQLEIEAEDTIDVSNCYLKYP